MKTESIVGREQSVFLALQLGETALPLIPGDAAGCSRFLLEALRVVDPLVMGCDALLRRLDQRLTVLCQDGPLATLEMEYQATVRRYLASLALRGMHRGVRYGQA